MSTGEALSAHSHSPLDLCPDVPRTVLGTAAAMVSGLTELIGETEL